MLGIMPFVGVHRPAGRLELAVDAVDRLADDLELIDRIGGCWRIELHGSTPCFRDDGAERALDQIDLEPVLFGGTRVGEKARSGRRCAPFGSSASAASTRHGLWATPPTATRPVPSGWITAPTETSAKA